MQGVFPLIFVFVSRFGKLTIDKGKYQLQVFPEAGHFVHEDQPTKTAQILADFYRRNDRSALVLPPKVADMQAFAAMKKGGDASGSPAPLK